MLVLGQPIELAPSEARTASWNSAEFQNDHCRGLMLNVNCSADPASASVTVNLQMFDPFAATPFWRTIDVWSYAIEAVGNEICIYSDGSASGIVFAAKTARPLPLGRFRLAFTHANGDSITYQVTGRGIL